LCDSHHTIHWSLFALRERQVKSQQVCGVRGLDQQGLSTIGREARQLAPELKIALTI